MVTIIKFGGSIITKKKNSESFPIELEKIGQEGRNYILEDNVAELSKEIVSAQNKKYQDLVLIHGAGPFGHTLVKRKDELEKPGDEVIHNSVCYLNNILIEIAERNELKLVHIPPFEVMNYEKGKFVFGKINDYLKYAKEENKIPLFHGDMVRLKDKSKDPRVENSVIVSGDDFPRIIYSYSIPIDKVIMVADTEVYDSDPHKNPNAKLIPYIKAKGKFSKAMKHYGITLTDEDQSGGFFGKVSKMFELSKEANIPTYIINGNKRGDLEAVLLGKDRGTKIAP